MTFKKWITSVKARQTMPEFEYNTLRNSSHIKQPHHTLRSSHPMRFSLTPLRNHSRHSGRPKFTFGHTSSIHFERHVWENRQPPRTDWALFFFFFILHSSTTPATPFSPPRHLPAFRRVNTRDTKLMILVCRGRAGGARQFISHLQRESQWGPEEKGPLEESLQPSTHPSASPPTHPPHPFD